MKLGDFQLSEHFWLREAMASQSATRFGIDNTPPVALLGSLCFTAQGLERVRAALGHRPIVPDSWYRCGSLNERVGSHGGSQHLRGEAVDFRAIGLPAPEAARMLASAGIDFDQIILEYPNRAEAAWLHVSFTFHRPARRELLHTVARGEYRIGLGNWA